MEAKDVKDDKTALANFAKTCCQEIATVAQRSSFPLNYTLQIVDKEGLNAYSSLGGYVYFHSGFLESLDKKSFDQGKKIICGTMAHEIAHSAIGHGRKTLEMAGLFFVSRTFLISAVQKILEMSYSTNLSDNSMYAYLFFALSIVSLYPTYKLANLYRLFFSQSNEYEADAIGQRFLSNTKYDDDSLIAALEFLRENHDTKDSSSCFKRLFASHPPLNNRIKKLQSLLQENQS